MNDLFSEVPLATMEMNPFTTIGKQWMLVTSGDIHSWNTIDPEDFIDPTVQNNYKTKDYHKMYIGEIEKVLTTVK